MLKKFTSVFFAVLIIFLCIPFNVSAYEPNDFTVSAEAGILVSLDTNEVLFEKNIDMKVYPASITKIMTVLLMLESDRFEYDGKVTMTADVDKYITGTGSAVSSIKVGEEIKQIDLVNLVLMASAGDCAYLAALFYGDTVENFVDMMNKRAEEMGLTGTHYGNPVGLHDEETYTTVRDIRTLATYAWQNEIFKTVASSKRYYMDATNMSGERVIVTTNYLQDSTTNYYYPYAKGMKTGFTNQAGRCLVSTASYNGYNYLCVLMKCPVETGRRHEFLDSANLYRWAFNNFSYKTVADSKNPVCEVKVDLSFETDHIPLYIEDGFVTVLPNEADASTIRIVPHLFEDTVDAPVKKGEVLGTADIVYAEKIIGTVNLVAGTTVKSSKILLTLRTVKKIFTSVYMKVIYVLIAVAIVAFIIATVCMNIKRTKRRKVKYIPYSDEKGKNRHD